MKRILMMTAAAMILGSPIYAQTAQPDLSGLQALVDSGQPLTEQQVRDALPGYTVSDIRIDEDGEVRADLVAEDGTEYRVRVDDGQIFYSTSDDPNGDGTSDVNDDDEEDDDEDDDNGGSSGASSDDSDDDSGDDNGGSSGTSSDDSDDDSDDDNGGSSGGGNGGGSSDGDDD